MFILTIKTGGAAFRDDSRTGRRGNALLDQQGAEVRRIMKDVARKLEMGYNGGNVMDVNGNKVGTWKYE